MNPFSGLSYIALATGDLDATIRFWRDMLGCRFVVDVEDGVHGVDLSPMFLHPGQ